jgi:hypothetical protein
MWSFEILEQLIMHNEAIVKGKLTIQSNGQTIVKMQFGNKDIMYKKGTEIPLSIGNDLKAAATDCLKKCAAEIGIAADIYNAEEFREIQVDLTTDDDILTQLKELYDLKGTELSNEETNFIDGVVYRQESQHYIKALNILKSK